MVNMNYGQNLDLIITIENVGDGATFDDVTVVYPVPEEMDLVSVTGNDWDVEYSTNGTTYSGTAPSPITDATHIRLTWTGIVAAGAVADTFTITLTPIVAGDTFDLTVEASTPIDHTAEDTISVTVAAPPVQDIDFWVYPYPGQNPYVGGLYYEGFEWQVYAEYENLEAGPLEGAVVIDWEIPAGVSITSAEVYDDSFERLEYSINNGADYTDVAPGDLSTVTNLRFIAEEVPEGTYSGVEIHVIGTVYDTPIDIEAVCSIKFGEYVAQSSTVGEPVTVVSDTDVDLQWGGATSASGSVGATGVTLQHGYLTNQGGVFVFTGDYEIIFEIPKPNITFHSLAVNQHHPAPRYLSTDGVVYVLATSYVGPAANVSHVKYLIGDVYDGQTSFNPAENFNLSFQINVNYVNAGVHPATYTIVPVAEDVGVTNKTKIFTYTIT